VVGDIRFESEERAPAEEEEEFCAARRPVLSRRRADGVADCACKRIKYRKAYRGTAEARQRRQRPREFGLRPWL
jgi:hypothetical protein